MVCVGLLINISKQRSAKVYTSPRSQVQVMLTYLNSKLKIITIELYQSFVLFAFASTSISIAKAYIYEHGHDPGQWLISTSPAARK